MARLWGWWRKEEHPGNRALRASVQEEISARLDMPGAARDPRLSVVDTEYLIRADSALSTSQRPRDKAIAHALAAMLAIEIRLPYSADELLSGEVNEVTRALKDSMDRRLKESYSPDAIARTRRRVRRRKP
jgi:hypothetical protein